MSIARRRRLLEAVRRGEGVVDDNANGEGLEAPETVEARRAAPPVREQREAAKKAADAKLRKTAAAAELAALPKDPVAAAGKYRSE